MTIRTLTAFVAVILVSCAPGPRDDPATELPATVPVAVQPVTISPVVHAPDETADSTDAPGGDNLLALGDEAEPDPELEPEDFEEGFCVDDLYGRFLTRQFEAVHPPKRAVSKLRRKRSAFDGMPSMDALFYAKNHFTGKATPYFGAIPVVTNERVQLWLQYFKTSGRAEFMQWLVRGESVKRIV